MAVHPKGEREMGEKKAVAVETFGGRVHVEWDPQAAVTPLGQFDADLALLVERQRGVKLLSRLFVGHRRQAALLEDGSQVLIH